MSTGTYLYVAGTLGTLCLVSFDTDAWGTVLKVSSDLTLQQFGSTCTDLSEHSSWGNPLIEHPVETSIGWSDQQL